MSVSRKTWHLRLSDPRCQFVNFTIKASGASFPVHKVYLAKKSPFFGGMFDIDRHCMEYEIKEHSVQAIEACLLYIYTDELGINPQNVYDVISLSQLLKLKTVTKKCESFLKENLNPSNCIQMKKIATGRSLYQLSEAANVMILSNAYKIAKKNVLGDLSPDEIRSLRNTTTQDDANSFWMIFQAWAKSTSDKVCEATDVVPYGNFTINSFKNAVWKHDHIYNCDNCKNVAAHQFLQCTKEIPDDSSPDDILFLKDIAKRFSFEKVEEMTYAHIEEYPDVFMSSCLIELFDTDELLARLANMETQCTLSIFNTLIQWMRRDRARHDAFKVIFQYAQDPDSEPQSTFLSSIGAFVGLSERCETDAFSDIENDCWFPQHSLFLKSLAKSYGYTRIERLVDECIVGDFARVSNLSEFVHLSAKDLKKYVSSLPTYDYGGKPVWEAVMRWVDHDYERRKDQFVDIFTSIKLDKFGNDLLQTDVVTNDLVIDSNRCRAHLVSLLISWSN